MRSRDLRICFGVFAAALSLLLLRFLVPRPVGAADNGDGWRLLCHLGTNEPSRISERFVQFTYVPSPPCRSNYVSSQLWLDRAAQWIGQAIGLGGGLNLILVGLLSVLLVALGIALIVLGLPLSDRGRLISAGLLFLAVADSAFFGYFASVVSEGAAFIGILLLVGGLLLLHQDGWLRYFGAAVTLVGGLIGINAKAQTLLILPVLFVALLLARRPRLTGRGRWALPLVVFAAIVGGTGYLQASGSPAGAEYREINMYHVIYNNIVDGQHDTNGDLAALGLPSSSARYIGTTWWMTPTGHQDPEYPLYRDRISRRNVAKYYLTHPVRTMQILQQSGQDLLTARPPNIGSYAKNSGLAPLAQEYRLPVISGPLQLIAPAGLVVLVPLWLIIGWHGLQAFRGRPREIGLVVLFVLVIAVGQFFVAALAEGIEGVKHQVIALFCTALAGVLALTSLLPRRVTQAPPAVDAELITLVARS